MPVAHLQIKALPSEIHDALRERARRRGMTMRDYVLDLIERDLALPTPEEWLAAVERLPKVDLRGGEAADAVRQAREERRERLVGD